MPAFFCVKLGQGCVSEDFATLGTLDALGHRISQSNLFRYTGS